MSSDDELIRSMYVEGVPGIADGPMPPLADPLTLEKLLEFRDLLEPERHGLSVMDKPRVG